VSIAHRTQRPSTPADRAERLGTIAGAVVVVPLLGAMGYGFWLLVRIVI
jgi:hypothetical protein